MKEEERPKIVGYKCLICDEVFDDIDDLELHFLAEHCWDEEKDDFELWCDENVDIVLDNGDTVPYDWEIPEPWLFDELEKLEEREDESDER